MHTNPECFLMVPHYRTDSLEHKFPASASAYPLSLTMNTHTHGNPNNKMQLHFMCAGLDAHISAHTTKWWPS
jgi:hypothetical protein